MNKNAIQVHLRSKTSVSPAYLSIHQPSNDNDGRISDPPRALCFSVSPWVLLLCRRRSSGFWLSLYYGEALSRAGCTDKWLVPNVILATSLEQCGCARSNWISGFRKIRKSATGKQSSIGRWLAVPDRARVAVHSFFYEPYSKGWKGGSSAWNLFQGIFKTKKQKD